MCNNINEPWGHYAKWNKQNKNVAYNLHVEAKKKNELRETE